MGEAKRKREKLSPVEKRAMELTHNLVNEGKLVAGGFAAWCMMHKIDINAPGPSFPLFHDAYMAGAEHLWTCIMGTLDPGVEVTPADMRRMDSIHSELQAWRKLKTDAMAQAYPTKGSA